ncbi:Uncharacterized conserved protein, DUF302 family [Arthrobacter crystallopoietes]|uniref:Uncharacterized conserved protein, DUF302 family n=1 Tax=Crystallibacter crystallopoietes TaxID=37928 RepID=A0A1H0XKE8_9MICC|nr:Uncharacterized conserved protein, DUF302 family [Arthrobacter crystallopoietes]
MTYTLTATVDLPWTEALDRTRDALSAQGFGILTEINVRSTFEAKLGAEAADAVATTSSSRLQPGPGQPRPPRRTEIGALLPCNVVVRRNKDAAVTTIEAIDPQTMVQLSETPAVKEVADDAGTRLRAALAGLNEATE